MTNKKRIVILNIIIAGFLIPFTSYGQRVATLEVINNLPTKISQFIPIGYSIIDTASGNLNLDSLNDMILVLRKDGEDSTSNFADNKPDKRPLIILLGQPNNVYKVAYRNDNAVCCIDCGGIFGDPFTGITIKNGYFSIEHGISGGEHWEQVITFKFDKLKSSWFLYKDHYISYKLNDSNNDNTNALVKDVDKLETAKDFGIISFDKFNIYNENGPQTPMRNVGGKQYSMKFKNWKIIKTELRSCLKSYDDADSLQGLLFSKGIIKNDTVVVCNEYEIMGDKPPICQTCPQYIPKNSISINSNQPILLGEKVLDIDINLYLPQAVFEVEKDNMKFIVIEFYNVSSTTVGGYYNYLIVVLDKANHIESHFTFPYKKEPVNNSDLIKNIQKNYNKKE